MQTQQLYKVIIQGKLEFGNDRSFQKVVQLYNQRLETIHKRELVFKISDEIFFEKDFTLNLGRFIGNISEKMWKNTILSLEYCAQFSFSGVINAWMTDNGKILQYAHIEPLGEKSTIALYQEGKRKSEEIGSEVEAIKMLTEAIEKYERHSQAYEKRGYMNYHLKNFEDAIYDFNKSIAFDQMNASSHYGLGRTYMVMKNFKEALICLEEATKQSIALQPIYWAARRVKAICYIELKDFEKAAFEYKLFTSRTFTESDPNFKHLAMAWFNYGKVFFALGQIDESLAAFDKSLALEPTAKKGTHPELFMQRGLARKAAGKSDYILDFKKASELGYEPATKLLAEIKLS